MNNYGGDYVLTDTNIITHLTVPTRDLAKTYLEWIGDRQIALNFQVLAELLSFSYSAERRRRLQLLLAAAVPLPHSEATSVWYSRVSATRRELKSRQAPGGDAGDADMWIISSALEHGIFCAPDDRQFVVLARAAGLATFTTLQDLTVENPR